MANRLLKSLTFPGLADKYIIGDESLSVSGAAADAKATGDALEIIDADLDQLKHYNFLFVGADGNLYYHEEE